MPRPSDHNMRHSVARLLRERRDALGMTQSELAESLSAQQSFVSKFEAGERKLDVVELLHICRALQIPLKEIAEKIQALWEDRSASD